MASGAVDGAGVTQGTDTIEETAWLFDLLDGRDEVVVVTGAIRHAVLFRTAPPFSSPAFG